MGSLEACIWFWIFKKTDYLRKYKEYPFLLWQIFLCILFILNSTYEYVKSFNILFYCYRASQNRMPVMVAVTKNRKFTKQEPKGLKCRSILPVAAKSTQDFVVKCHWLSLSLVTVLWIKKVEWTLMPHFPCSYNCVINWPWIFFLPFLFCSLFVCLQCGLSTHHLCDLHITQLSC